MRAIVGKEKIIVIAVLVLWLFSKDCSNDKSLPFINSLPRGWVYTGRTNWLAFHWKGNTGRQPGNVRVTEAFKDYVPNEDFLQRNMESMHILVEAGVNVDYKGGHFSHQSRGNFYSDWTPFREESNLRIKW